MSQISLTFPDGSIRDYPAGTTPAQVAASIAPSLAKNAISARKKKLRKPTKIGRAHV